jgi:hypothetical protein
VRKQRGRGEEMCEKNERGRVLYTGEDEKVKEKGWPQASLQRVTLDRFFYFFK